MAISVICAWIAVLALMLTALKYVAKRNKTVNRIFRKIHIPAGIVLMGAGLAHGLLAGNSPGASLGEITLGAELFSLNAGTLCFVLAIALGLTYCFRKPLRRYWLRLHRVLTVMILTVLVIHVAQVGITLPALFRTESMNSSEIEAVEDTVETSREAAAPVAEAEQETETTATAAPETTVTAEVTDETGQGLSGQMDVTFSGAKLNDGTYEGSAEGYKSTIRVSVTVEGGAVTSVDIVSQSDTPKFWSRAAGLADTIVSEQSLQVDAVSGATYSSRGILCAVYDALEEAVSEGELQITIPEPRGGRH